MVGEAETGGPIGGVVPIGPPVRLGFVLVQAVGAAALGSSVKALRKGWNVATASVSSRSFLLSSAISMSRGSPASRVVTTDVAAGAAGAEGPPGYHGELDATCVGTGVEAGVGAAAVAGAAATGAASLSRRSPTPCCRVSSWMRRRTDADGFCCAFHHSWVHRSVWGIETRLRTDSVRVAVSVTRMWMSVVFNFLLLDWVMSAWSGCAR